MKSNSTTKRGRHKKEIVNENNFKTIRTRLLKERRMTLQELSDMTNISKSLLGYFETGERIPSLDDLISISKALDVPIDYLVGLQDSKSKDLTINSISKFLNINDDSIYSLQRLCKKDNYSKYINELLFDYLNIDELMYLIKKYFDYEYYFDSENDPIMLDGVWNVDKTELYINEMRKTLIKLKDTCSISKEKYIKNIKDIEKRIKEEKKNDDNLEYKEKYLQYLNSELDKYNILLKKCKSVVSAKEFEEKEKYAYELLREEEKKNAKK